MTRFQPLFDRLDKFYEDTHPITSPDANVLPEDRELYINEMDKLLEEVDLAFPKLSTEEVERCLGLLRKIDPIATALVGHPVSQDYDLEDEPDNVVYLDDKRFEKFFGGTFDQGTFLWREMTEEDLMGTFDQGSFLRHEMTEEEFMVGMAIPCENPACEGHGCGDEPRVVIHPFGIEDPHIISLSIEEAVKLGVSLIRAAEGARLQITPVEK